MNAWLNSSKAVQEQSLGVALIYFFEVTINTPCTLFSVQTKGKNRDQSSSEWVFFKWILRDRFQDI